VGFGISGIKPSDLTNRQLVWFSVQWRIAQWVMLMTLQFSSIIVVKRSEVTCACCDKFKTELQKTLIELKSAPKIIELL
jgi:hypothetical protein